MTIITEGMRRAQVAVDHKNQEKDHFYPTPPAATEALLRVEKFDGEIWEPACGDGAISEVLRKHGHQVRSTDLVFRGYGGGGVDFLMELHAAKTANIITNPPFKLAQPFIEKALTLTTGKVAMLLRLAFLEGKRRKLMFETTPLARVHVFSERIRMQRGRQANDTDGSGAVAFAWFVWEHGYMGKPTVGWI